MLHGHAPLSQQVLDYATLLIPIIPPRWSSLMRTKEEAAQLRRSTLLSVGHEGEDGMRKRLHLPSFADNDRPLSGTPDLGLNSGVLYLRVTISNKNRSLCTCPHLAQKLLDYLDPGQNRFGYTGRPTNRRGFSFVAGQGRKEKHNYLQLKMATLSLSCCQWLRN